MAPGPDGPWGRWCPLQGSERVEMLMEKKLVEKDMLKIKNIEKVRCGVFGITLTQ